MPLLDFKITELGKDGMSMKFQAKFDKPYMLGLIMKKSDNLYIHFKYHLLDTKGYFKEQYRDFEKMWLGNATLTRLWKDRCAEDRTADIINPYGSTKSREKLFVRKRIDL